MKITSILFTLLILAGSLIAKPDTYPDFKTLKNNLEGIAKKYTSLAQLESLGTTTDGRQVLLLKLGSGDKDAKPAVLLVAGVNGTDLAGTEIIMQFIQSTVINYGKIDSITKMLDQTTFYIFPRVNPDATESLFLSPAYARSLNNRPLDLDSDGKVDEDGYDDLDKDGLITQMRITEPGGDWIEDEDHIGLLRRADPNKGEEGVFRLVREGFDNDGDGNLNEDETGGVNFNKNFTYNYKFFEFGSGLHQISEIETRAVVDFAYTHSNIAAVFSFSPNDNLITPWEPSKKTAANDTKERGQQPVTSVDNLDAPFFKYISDEFKKITGISDLPAVESGSGVFSEWAYYHFGRWSLSTPAWTPPLVESQKDTSMRVNESDSNDSTEIKNPKNLSKPPTEGKKTYDQRLWEWLKTTNQGEGFVEWKELKHQDYPDKKVEVGGFYPMVYANPPRDSLSTISHNFQAFVTKLGFWLPQIDINRLKVEHLHDNVYRVSMIVQNEGYLPTNPHIGILNKWCPKVKVSLELKNNQELASGRVLNFIDILPGSGGSKEFNWLILGRSGESIKLSAGSPMTGEIVKTITLKK